MENCYNNNNKIITICILIMVCVSGLVECRPTLINLGSTHTTKGNAAGKGKSPKTGGNEYSATWCYTRIKYETKKVCRGDDCVDVTISKTVYECIAI